MPSFLSGLARLARAATLFGAVAALAQLSTPAWAQTGAKALAKVSIRLDWKPGGQHVPFFIGKARGFYEAEGIDLTILPGSGSSDSVKQLGSGAVDLALVDSLVLVQAAEQGVPIKSVGAYYQRTPIVLLSKQAKPIDDPKQLLSGVKVGSKRASATFQGLTAMLASNKIDLKKVNLVDIGFGVQPLLLGQVDALMGFTMNEAVDAESAGTPVHEMAIADHGVTAYGLTMASNDKFIAAHPELIRGFLRATRKAVETSVADSPGSVKALIASTSELDADHEAKVLAKTIPFWLAKPGDLPSFGAQSLQGWQHTVETAQRVGLVEDAPQAAKLFTPGLEK